MKVDKPWGYYVDLSEEQGEWKLKNLFVAANEELSVQSHQLRTEIWFVQEGMGMAYVYEGPYSNSYQDLFPGAVIVIRPNQKHNIEATTDLKILELQIGECQESDITRYKDKYGRK